MKHTIRHECEHMSKKDGGGACRRCLEPFSHRFPLFPMKKLPWGLEFKERHIRDYATRNKVLVDTAKEKWEDFMLISPSGARYSIEFARMI